MGSWVTWLALAGIMVLLELSSGTFYLLMVALGMVAGALVAFIGWPLPFQLLIAASVGAAATFILRRTRLNSTHQVLASRDPNVHLDIGQTIQVNKWQEVENGLYQSRVMYRGALWNVEFIGEREEDEPTAGLYKIIEIRGSDLIVTFPHASSID